MLRLVCNDILRVWAQFRNGMNCTMQKRIAPLQFRIPTDVVMENFYHMGTVYVEKC